MSSSSMILRRSLSANRQWLPTSCLARHARRVVKELHREAFRIDSTYSGTAGVTMVQKA